ncbi:thioredoxin [Sulfurimonas sp.]|uniref:thioredoxin n=1 Tax=Sulfurimonas sp. TaxID=2022749 RepID=UPI003569F5C1
MAYIDLTESNFNDTVEQNNIVIIDFWAEWCGPCIQFGPVFEKVAGENTDVAFAKVNTEIEQALAGHFQVQSIPTLMVIKERVVIFNQAGALDEVSLNGLIQQVKELDMNKVRAEMNTEN